MAGKPSKLQPGDYVYTIFNDALIWALPDQKPWSVAPPSDSGKPRTVDPGRDTWRENWQRRLPSKDTGGALL
ncbi:MAG: hypothetical protein R2932_13230 [Caldilineaceae bacterium]